MPCTLVQCLIRVLWEPARMLRFCMWLQSVNQRFRREGRWGVHAEKKVPQKVLSYCVHSKDALFLG